MEEFVTRDTTRRVDISIDLNTTNKADGSFSSIFRLRFAAFFFFLIDFLKLAEELVLEAEGPGLTSISPHTIMLALKEAELLLV